MKKINLWGLWIATILIVLISAIQALSGHWVTFFLLWPGGPDYGNTFIQAMLALGTYHRIGGWITGGLSVVILYFAFFSGSSIYTRISAVVGFIMTVLAAWGGYLYVTSSFGDRMSLGQMADAAVGVTGVYLIQLFFMNKTPRFPWVKHSAEV